MIEYIDHVVIFVTDMDRAIEFYAKKLGLKVDYPSPEYTSLEVPGQTSIGLHITNKVSNSPSSTQVSFAVSDIERALMDMKTKNVKITREIEEIAPNRFMFNFEDPEGNQLSYFEYRRD